MEADLTSTPALTDEDARRCGHYLRDDSTFAVLVASATFLGADRGDLPRLAQGREGAKALAEFVLAADQRAGVICELADHVDRAATVARVALMRRPDYATLMAEVDAQSGQA